MMRIKYGFIAALTAIFFAGCGVVLYHHLIADGIRVNCSALIQYDHRGPDFASVVEVNFRLFKNNTGRATLSGTINTAGEKQTISRSIAFAWDALYSDEIAVHSFAYIKNIKDSAMDDIFKKSFLYAPEGASRQLRLSPLKNAWLIGNVQSPFALCINKMR
ncbi:hypothetical protein [Enterobacter chuandaensis]|uniref:hypothetical protein n=1 Tax=Enterobacter chuandaensis TaxID=2497875 RepID=UPI003D6E51C3